MISIDGFAPAGYICRDMRSLRLLREILGIRQDTLATAAEITRQTLSEFENGRAFPSRRAAQRLDDAVVKIVDERAIAAAEALRNESVPGRNATEADHG